MSDGGRGARASVERGLPGDTAAAGQEFERHMQARRLELGDEAGRKALRGAGGWAVRNSVRRWLNRLTEKIGEHHLGKLRLETAEAKAERNVNEELGRLNWKVTSHPAVPRPTSPLVSTNKIAPRQKGLPRGTVKEINDKLHRM